MLGSEMALEPAKLADFQLQGALGSGATANVYEAIHVATGQPVAIKLMAEAPQGHEMRERFAREALFLSEVQSRHVSTILGYGFEKGQPFLVLERLDGETLDAKLRREGAVPIASAGRWIEQLIIGIRDCHDAKVIHRDIKPGNIFLHRDGHAVTVKLIDFGVARLREVAGVDASALTSPSHVIGSMGYMAPEQFKSAKSVGFTADLYAVGVVIFRVLTGRLPFVSRSLDAVIRMKSEQPVPSITAMLGGNQPQVLDWIIGKAMARDPEARFQSAREMLDQWRRVLAATVAQPPPLPPRPSTAPSPMRRSDQKTAPLPSHPPPAVGRASHPADLEERTMRDATEHLRVEDPEDKTEKYAPVIEIEDMIPVTLPSADAGEDPFEKPTDPHADLTAIVQHELELEKTRRRGGR